MKPKKCRYHWSVFVFAWLVLLLILAGCSNDEGIPPKLDSSERSTESTHDEKTFQTLEDLYESKKTTKKSEWVKESVADTLRSSSWKIKGGSLLNFDQTDNIFSLDFILHKSFYAKYKVFQDSIIEIDFYQRGNPREFKVHLEADSMKFIACEGDEIELFPMEYIDFDYEEQSH